MEPLGFTRLNDLPGPADRPRAEAAVDPSPLRGVWHSTNRATRGIIKLILSDADGNFTVRAFGACEPSPVEWGAVAGDAFADGVGLKAGVGFRAFYEFGFMQTALAAYLNKRILVVDAYNTFKDGSGRHNYFSRDHFYQ
jgi:hypothetical protein